MIGNYFGDPSVKPCGICDVCLNTKRAELSKNEFATIQSEITEILKDGPAPVAEVLLKLKGVKKEKTMEVIRFMQSENKLAVTEQGWIKVK
jgi:ATP-dependent DNA helicase RecQ